MFARQLTPESIWLSMYIQEVLSPGFIMSRRIVHNAAANATNVKAKSKPIHLECSAGDPCRAGNYKQSARGSRPARRTLFGSKAASHVPPFKTCEQERRRS